MTDARLLSDDEIAQARPTRKRASKDAAETKAPVLNAEAASPEGVAPKPRTRRTKAAEVVIAPVATDAPAPAAGVPPVQSHADSTPPAEKAAKAPARTRSRASTAAPAFSQPETSAAPPSAEAAPTPVVRRKATATPKATPAAAPEAPTPVTPAAEAAPAIIREAVATPTAAVTKPSSTATRKSAPASSTPEAAAPSKQPNSVEGEIAATARPVRRPHRRTMVATTEAAGTSPTQSPEAEASSPAIDTQPTTQQAPAAVSPAPAAILAAQPATFVDRGEDATAYSEPPKTTPILSPPTSATQATPSAPTQPSSMQPGSFRQGAGNANRPGTFRPANQQQRLGPGQPPRQPFTPRPQNTTPVNGQNDGGQGDAQRGRRRRRRRGRGMNGAPLPPTNGSQAGSSTNGIAPTSSGFNAPAPVYEERPPAQEYIAPRMPAPMAVFEAAGILDFLPNGEAFLREPDLRQRSDDVLIGVRDVRRFDLRNGDMVRLELRPGRGRGPVAVERVITINDMLFDSIGSRPRFEDLTPIYPNRMIMLETGQTPLTTRLLDMIAPVGFGQRALIVSPPKAGKTTILKHIGQGVLANYPNASLILCLVGERPEEVTDLRMSLPRGIMYASSFDEEVERHGHLAEMALERAKRLAEMGKDVVVLLDSITRLARAYNLGPGGGGRTLSGGMDASALTTARRIFGAARAIEQGGSLTIIATCLVDTGSRLDDVVYEEFKGTGNMELHLDRQLAERRIFPAIDITKSSTRKEELLLDPQTLQWIVLLRRRLAGASAVQATEQFIDRLGKTPSNKVFLELLGRTQS